jgi:hypothetical protein
MNSSANESYEESALAPEPVPTFEQEIWRRVLKMMYGHAELPLSAGQDEEVLFIQQDIARRLLRADTEDEEELLKLICGYASVPCDRVIHWARARFPLAV